MSVDAFHFLRPYWFIALLPLALCIWFVAKNKLARGNWSEVCDDALLPHILQDNNQPMRHRWRSITVSIASLLAIIALAGPTWEQLPSPVFRNDAALVIALDLSRSMNATDIKPSRLIRARYKLADILQQRKDGLTALIAYAGDAFTVTPLTNDTATISSQVNALSTNIMPSQGNNTRAALDLAVQLLKQAGQTQGSILLISDDVQVNLDDHVKDIATNYTVSILGVGTTDGAPVKLADGGFLKDQQGSIVIPKLNSSLLTSLTRSGKGLYRPISSDDSDIKALMTHIDAKTNADTTQNDEHVIEQWAEQGPWLLLLILPLAALYFRKGLLIVPVITLLNYPQDSYAFEWQDLWQTDDQQAQQIFKQEDYSQAAEQFDSPEWRAAAHYKSEQYQQAAETLKSIGQKTADDYYNQGTALAKANQLESAIESYEQALKLDPKHEDAQYNKQQVEDALKKQQQQDNKDKQSQQGDNKQQNQDQNQDDQKPESNGQQSDQQDQQSKSDSQQNSLEKNKQKDSQKPEEEDKSQKSEDKNPAESQQQADEQNEDEQQLTPQQQSESDEQKQAQQQWLKRIPDDPAGLLKRKFKYQYNQRNNNSSQEQSW